jgi:hypothetical protein
MLRGFLVGRFAGLRGWPVGFAFGADFFLAGCAA